MSVNKFIGIGNLTKDPEVRYMANGEAVANCSIACNEKWKNKAGEKQESVEFINLTFYKRLAEVVGEYAKKGTQIYVEGKLQTRKWQDKEGKDRYTTEIVCHEMTMLGDKQNSQAGTPSISKSESNEQKSPPKINPQAPMDNFNDDIPF